MATSYAHGGLNHLASEATDITSMMSFGFSISADWLHHNTGINPAQPLGECTNQYCEDAGEATEVAMIITPGAGGKAKAATKAAKAAPMLVQSSTEGKILAREARELAEYLLQRIG